MSTPNQNVIEEKLKKLRGTYLDPDFQKRVTDTEQALRRNIARSKLAQREEVKGIVEEGVKAIKDISWLLANDEELTQTQRDALFAEKRVHQFYLERLDGTRAQQALAVIAETVDSIEAPGK